jgi:hypothetical protein
LRSPGLGRAELERRGDDKGVEHMRGAEARLRPMRASILAKRAALHCNRKEYLAAGRDLLTALRIDPTEPDGKRYATDVISGLLQEANASDAAGKRDEAREAVGLVLALCPEDERGNALEARRSARK